MTGLRIAPWAWVAFTGAAAAQGEGQAAAPTPLDVARLEHGVRTALERVPVVPGLAIGVVENSRVVLATGMGYRDLEHKLPFTPQTRVYIASVTKSFVAAAATKLAGRQRIELDSPLTRYLPDLHLEPPLRLDHLCLRDLLVHRTGMDNPALVFHGSYSGALDDDHALRLLAASGTRSRSFHYSNLGYLFAGRVLTAATGRTWQELVTAELLRPLGMTATGCSTDAFDGDDRAQPYAAEENGFRRLVFLKRDATMNAAGGMVSTLRDMLRWLRVHMDGGVLDGQRVLEARVVEQLHAPQIAVRSSYWGIFARHAYGLGWYLGSYEGHRMLQCFGDYPGYRAHVSFLPRRGVGVVILANEGRDGTFLPDYIAQHVYDLAIGVEDPERRFEQRLASYAALIENRLRAGRDTQRHDRGHALPRGVDSSSLVGSYTSPAFGQLVVGAADGGLRAELGQLSSWLVHRGTTTYSADLIPGGWQNYRLTFDPAVDGPLDGPVDGNCPAVSVDLNGVRTRFERAR